MFEAARFKTVVWQRLSFFPKFIPRTIHRMFRGVGPFVETTPVVRALCTANIFGFVAAPS